MKKLLRKALFLAVAAVITTGATAALANPGMWGGQGMPFGQPGSGYGQQQGQGNGGSYGQPGLGNTERFGWGNNQQQPGQRFAPGQQQPGQGFAPGGPVPGRPGMPLPPRGDRIRGVIKAVDENELTVETRAGEITVTIEERTRVVEVRKSLEPVGALEGQHVILVGRRDGDGFRAKAVVILADKLANDVADMPAGI